MVKYKMNIRYKNFNIKSENIENLLCIFFCLLFIYKYVWKGIECILVFYVIIILEINLLLK